MVPTTSTRGSREAPGKDKDTGLEEAQGPVWGLMAPVASMLQGLGVGSLQASGIPRKLGVSLEQCGP